jgi:hypothetical protein
MNWIDVLDRLPEPRVEVLTFWECSGVFAFHISRIDPDDHGVWNMDNGGSEKVEDNLVTHWCHLVGPNGETVE